MTDARLLIQATVGVPATSGNAVTVLRNGDEIFPAMLAAIAEAEQSVLLSTYVYWTGDIAEQVADALAERARAGVDVRVLVDWVGGRLMSPDIVERITEAGGDFAWFRPPSKLAKAAISMDETFTGQHRTHRKVLVCDGRVGFTGGVGIAEEWTGCADAPESWRDTHVRFEGPCVTSLVSAFGTNWHEATGERLPLADLLPTEEHAPGDVDVQFVRGQPGQFATDIALVLRALMENAGNRIWIATAYLVPDEAMLTLLCEAVERGVDVRIVVPGPHVDKRVSRLAARASFEPLLEAGVRLYEFQPTMLHCKVAVIDDVAIVGSANMNMRSLEQDDEVIGVIHGPAVVAELASHIVDDIGRSDEMELGRFEQRSLSEKFAESAVDTIRAML